jgi:hypothetical protein
MKTMKNKLNYTVVCVLLLLGCCFEISAAKLAYFNVEENLYVEALNNKMNALTQEDKGSENTDKIILYELSVYGEFFGSDSIKKTIDCYFLLKTKKAEQDSTFELLDDFLNLWGRKTTMVLAHNYKNLAADQKLMADKLCSQIEGKQKWLFLKSDEQYLKYAKYWCEIGKLSSQGVAEAKAIVVEMEKIKITSSNKINLKIDASHELSHNGGSLSINQGKVSNLRGGIYTGIAQDWSSNARWVKTVSSGRGYGREIIAWRGENVGGMVQTIRAKKTKTERELYLFKFDGYVRPWLGGVISEISLEECKIICMRGASAVYDDIRNSVNYEDSKNLCKFGSRSSSIKIIERIRKLNGDIKGLECCLILYAKRLPQMNNKQDQLMLEASHRSLK